MTGIQVAQEVFKTKSAHLFRPRKNESGEYDCKPVFTGSHKGWTILDLFSASAIVQVHERINAQNQELLESFSLPKMARIAFKCLEEKTK